MTQIMNKSFKNIQLFKLHYYPNNFYMNKLFYFLLMFMTLIPIISIFLTNFIHLWVLMEINTIILISTMSIYIKKFKSTLNFFIIQSFSSLILIFLLMMKNNIMNELSNMMINYMLMLAFSMKLGLFPFHFWPPMINMNINWILILIMSTSQKFIPLIIFNLFFNQIMNYQILLMNLSISILSSFMSTIMNIHEMNLKKIMTLSSTNHLSWMFMIIMFDSSLFLMYFLIYTLSMIFMSLIFNKLNITSIKSLSKIQLFNFKKINFFISINLLIISALPPFFTFIMKINLMKIFIENSSILSSFLLTITSIFSLIFYMNIIIKMNMLNLMKIKFYKFNKFTMKFNFSSLILISILSLTFLFYILYMS
uniref:NADH-ubiquinone oxidoreductase chain 2 n=2 Tax=Vespa velutina TaxID=202808 RepID=A0A347YEJ0_VESVE|nr:NADH dehydrogenase subunit 2 [Vespa velutina]QKG04141.1 NADH dehydrogenase subunit 2 [Vespa velutina auraria]BAX73950.1 NADH dehydrogenase subunit 2 [Vespa velutina]BBC27608.1 NADH dehydrogenase subunit 2 [Vespa velutina]BBC27621.1 NADH dehydrogenase subunit 2 [Vespa velutina]BBC44282.1 NADH dehydrogenase subunit 2 [Vespa velutina]